jgi:hypothetical protein
VSYIWCISAKRMQGVERMMRLQNTILHHRRLRVPCLPSSSATVATVFLVHFQYSCSIGPARGRQGGSALYRRCSTESFPAARNWQSGRLLDTVTDHHQAELIRNFQQFNRILTSLQLATHTNRDAYEEHQAPRLVNHIYHML